MRRSGRPTDRTFDGRFTLTTTEGDDRFAVLYRRRLRPVYAIENYGTGNAVHVTQALFTTEEVFHFSADESPLP